MAVVAKCLSSDSVYTGTGTGTNIHMLAKLSPDAEQLEIWPRRAKIRLRYAL
jgi:hypothetical protein